VRIMAVAVAVFLLASVTAGHAVQVQKQGGAERKQAQPAKTVVDPVCGMTIDPSKAAGKSEHKGTTYFFCSDHCKKTFDADPEGTLKKAAQKKK